MKQRPRPVIRSTWIHSNCRQETQSPCRRKNGDTNDCEVTAITQGTNTWVKDFAIQFGSSDRCELKLWSTTVQSGGTGNAALTYSQNAPTNYASVVFEESSGHDMGDPMIPSDYAAPDMAAAQDRLGEAIARARAASALKHA